MRVAIKEIEWRTGLMDKDVWYAGNGLPYKIRLDRGNPDLYIVSGLPGGSSNPWNTFEEAKLYVYGQHQLFVMKLIEVVND